MAGIPTPIKSVAHRFQLWKQSDESRTASDPRDANIV